MEHDMTSSAKVDIEVDIEADSQADSWFAKLGPGLITGAADVDPSGIATYSQAGAQFGFNLLWTVLLTYPLMVAIQVVSASIGRVSGHGLATNLRRHYPGGCCTALSSFCWWRTRSTLQPT
jgi:NRAMP (natural resistance-associated macrophage protein)-like metal ion transporter